MERYAGIFDRIALAMTGKRNPWGKAGGGSGGDSGDGGGDSGDDGPPKAGDDAPSEGDKSGGPRNPWATGSSNGGGGDKPRRSGNIEDIFRNRGPEGPKRGGGGGSGSGGPNFTFPQRSGGKSWAPLIIGAVVLGWVAVNSVHFIQPREQAVVTWAGGKYSKTLQPGTNFTLPSPLQMVDVEDVSQVRSSRIPADGEEKLILTGDQNLVDLSYLIRWNIKDLPLYRFQLAQPEETVAEVAEAAMRAAVAGHTLDEVMSGAGRAEIEQDVLANMQDILDGYKSGVLVQGIEINKADPPVRVEEAFKDVSSAQQDADAFKNEARAVAQQWLNRAEGDAAEFNNIYAEYLLAPQVTRRRLYYETMELVLSETDKMIVETDGVTPYLPLPELNRRAKAAPAATVVVEGGQ